MFEGFKLETVDLPESSLRVRYGGSGPPLLLLHGHPRTHVTWHRVAPLLAADHTVVCPDLRGFGRSSVPADAVDHAGSSKRAKARDCIALMRHLGFGRFAIAGHDRGSYTAFRAAMDHPSAISHLIVMDSVPILEALERCDARFAKLWWHWFFFAQRTSPNAQSWPILTHGMAAQPGPWGLRPISTTRTQSTIRMLFTACLKTIGQVWPSTNCTMPTTGKLVAGSRARPWRSGPPAMILGHSTATCSMFGDPGPPN
ncbi:alpha/beta fold hydrolase [Mesorhizobium sp. M0589]|uniref:alpha/beta fold hydrolase n=1 Tax=Mesorhizobium sp. M0589 TaxID=2956965 RepID=UPI00333620F9